jgi:hypothetical protein
VKVVVMAAAILRKLFNCIVLPSKHRCSRKESRLNDHVFQLPTKFMLKGRRKSRKVQRNEEIKFKQKWNDHFAPSGESRTRC